MVTVKRGKPHFLTAKKEGCQDITLQTGEKFDPASLLGILIDFGIISIPLDMMIGGAWKTEPKSYMVIQCVPRHNKEANSHEGNRITYADYFCFSFSGCASMINGTSDTINITSMTPNAELYVDGNPAGKGTAIVTVKRGKPHFILAKKPGCQDTTIQTGEKFDATSLLGILIDFGIITIPLDMLIGGAWKTEPKTYMVSPMCDVAARSSGGTAFKVSARPGKESTSSFTVERRLSETPIRRGGQLRRSPLRGASARTPSSTSSARAFQRT